MKVLLVSSLFPPDQRGGAEVVAAAQAASLRAEGHQVTVLTTAASGPRWRREVGADGTVVLRYRPPNLFSFHRIGNHGVAARALWHIIDTLSPAAGRAVARVLSEGGYGLAVSHNLKGLGYTAAVALRRSGVPWIHTCHDVQLLLPSGLLLWGREGELSRAWNQLYAALCRKLFGSPTEVRFGSRWLRDIYSNHGFFGSSHLSVIPSSLSEEGVPERPVPSGGTLRLLFVGQVEPHKGVVWLAEQLEELERLLNRPVTLAVAGTGKALGDVQRLGRGRLSYLGVVPRERVGQTMASHDVVVVPSLCYENAPTVIAEARAAGTLVVASSVGGAPELVSDSSRCFAPGDVSSLAACLKQLPSR